jgi:type VI secretion system secreted protein VgrG
MLFEANTAQIQFEAAELAPDTFQVVGYEGQEEISSPFELQIELISEDPAVDFAEVVNHPATLTTLRDGEEVPVCGVVAHFEQGGHTADWYGYRAVLVPRLWLLSLSYQSRIFQEKTVEEIATEVLEDAGLSGGDFRFELGESYEPREYCVQYQETNLNFLSRLFEYEGIHYYFEHGNKDVLVMSDDSTQNPRISGEDTVIYNVGGGLVPEAEAVRELVCREQVVTGKVVLKDYNYRTPETDLEVESQLNGEMPGERYEYGQHYKDTSQGDRLAKVRNEEIECQRRVMTGESDCAALKAGHLFTLEEHYREDLNGDYLITEITHRGHQGAALPGVAPSGSDEQERYRNEFTAIPADVVYRPPRKTPVPEVPGIITARTETAGGEYAYLNEDGEYRVKTNFDRSDVTDGQASRPIRKAEPYTGPNYGIHFPNHADTEMILACVDGNPDRPMALGTASNPSQKSPATSTNKQQNVIRTWGQNELTFDDTSGSENIYLHGTKDWTIEITNDKDQTVGNNESLVVESNRDKKVGGNQTAEVSGDKTVEVGGGLTEQVAGNKSLTVMGNHGEEISGNMSQTVSSAKSETITLAKALSIGAGYQVSVGGAENHTVGGLLAQEVGAAKTVAVGLASTENVGKSKSVSAGQNISQKAGKDVSVQSGKKMTLSAGDDVAISGKKKGVIEVSDELVLKCGKAQIVMKKNGDVQIKGNNIQVKGSGKINIKASSDVKIDGSKVNIK